MPSRRLLTHTGCWAIFIAYEVTVALLLGSRASFWQFVAFYIPNIVLFYFNAHIILNSVTGVKKLPLLIGLTICELAIYVLITLSLEILLGNLDLQNASSSEIRIDLIRAIWRGIYFIGLSTAYWFALRTVKAIRDAQQSKIYQLESERKQVELEKKTIQLENAFLQAQVNPHLLLNALNFIYGAVESHPKKAGEGILLLADIMRYALNEAREDGKVTIENELENIKKYIRLYLLRFHNQLHVKADFRLTKEILGKRIPPLLFLTFVENVFKHGNLTDSTRPGLILIVSEGGNVLRFLSKNKKRRKKVDESYHIGISNALSRLNNYYGKENVNLTVKEIEDNFILKIKVQL